MKALNAFFRSEWYIALIVVMMTLSELFGLELPYYYATIPLVALNVLFAEDALGIVPLICCSYMTVARINYPVTNPETTILRDPSVLTQIIVIASIDAAFLIARLVYSLIRNPNRTVPKLSLGFLWLGVFYVLSGVFSPYFSGLNVAAGLLQIASLCVFYFFLYYTLDWKRVPHDYVFTLFFAIGIGIACEILAMYLDDGIFQEAMINRDFLYTGWGTYNTVGCVMAMMMPAPFYFAVKSARHSWAYSVVGVMFLVCVILTQSRGSIIFGSGVFVLCMVFTLITTKGRQRIYNFIVFALGALGLVLALSVFREEVERIFGSLFDKGFDSSGRLEIFKESWRRFCNYPLFGIGWMGTEQGEQAFDIYYSHNTVLQLLMTGGILLFLAYIYHRLQTLELLFRHPTVEKTVIALCICSLLATCMLDCHIFSFGPGVLYSVLLV
ncbi:MAG: O-antigen ligase family protein, partial [Clostridia bacterium]|nr:O-antigen ligase family protein [Clostridia bacterium]